MHIKGGLTGLILFLLAPSLLFATLWFHNSFGNVRAIDRNLAGVGAIQALAPLIREKALTGRVETDPDAIRQQLVETAGSQRADALTRTFKTFLEEENVPQALRSARSLVSSLSAMSDLQASTTFETTMLPRLINETLLSVVIESAAMANTAGSLAERTSINRWNKMLLSVQGGQFKAVADEAARETFRNVAQLKAESAAQLRQAAQIYRNTNVAFQNQASKLLTSVMAAETGADIRFNPLVVAQPELADAALSLWHEATDQLRQDLKRQRTDTLWTVGIAALVICVVITAVVATGLAATRALADRTREEFVNLGFHDPLTGLPNRRALARAIRSMPEAGPDTRTGLMLIDLRHFKKINDRYGDHIGDAILREVADQLGHYAQPDDFLSRSGGTEFMLLRPDLRDPEAFEHLCNEIMDNLSKERFVRGHRTTLEANAGLFIGEPGVWITDQILVDVALALRSAKQKGPKQCDMFTTEMRTAFEENGHIVKALSKALQNGQILPWFQPQVDIHTGEVIGAEALVRWIDEDRIRYPGTFLPAALEAGYMEMIETTVQKKALQLAAELDPDMRRCMRLSLNMSSSLLTNSQAVDMLVHQVRDMDLEPSSISLEILEAVMIDEIAATPIKDNVSRLAELGFYIELDDFGTGHSSISSLRDLKVDRVKIDRSFVSKVDSNPGLQRFTSALINLAKSLDISVLAEGVETEEEWHWLKQNGCDVVQGFLISRAVPENELSAMILKRGPMAGRKLCAL